MCGLTGLVTPEGTSDELVRTVRSMSDALVHRGPDDSGEWVDAGCGVALGFRRLSVIDLSPAGHQPMVSASGRFVTTLNGEVYNFEALRRELVSTGQAPAFRGHSDTEVLLAAFEAWGVGAAVRRFIGMFAIAVWDRVERRLYLIRDRMGVKPLYYGTAGTTFVYGSELKAMRRHPEFDERVDRGSVALFLRYMYVPAPYSIFENVRKVPPGTILTYDPATRATSIDAYWSAAEAAERGMRNRFRGTEDEAAGELDLLLRDAVRLRMIADVPLGVFLSGGIDSSLVTALMQAQSARPVRSFSIGFGEEKYDEAKFAAAVARHLGTDHTEMIVTDQDAWDVIPRLPAMYDEPFADSSQIPTHLVACLARKYVTVALSGDGGDELFGGYTRYFLGQRVFRALSLVPHALRPAAGRMLGAIRTDTWDRIAGMPGKLVPHAFRLHPGARIHKVARVLAADDLDEMYFELVSHWSDVVPGATPHRLPLDDRSTWPPLEHPIERMMYFDQISYLPDDILAKVDRASMAASLEAREPLLDHRLVEFAWTLPLSMKVRASRGKRVLRRVLDRYVPPVLIDRPKMGFGIPLGEWLRGPLRDWAESLLDPATLRDGGLLDVQQVRSKWDEHLAGRGEWKYHLWAVLMLQAWRAT